MDPRHERYRGRGRSSDRSHICLARIVESGLRADRRENQGDAPASSIYPCRRHIADRHTWPYQWGTGAGGPDRKWRDARPVDHRVAAGDRGDVCRHDHGIGNRRALFYRSGWRARGPACFFKRKSSSVSHQEYRAHDRAAHWRETACWCQPAAAHCSSCLWRRVWTDASTFARCGEGFARCTVASPR